MSSCVVMPEECINRAYPTATIISPCRDIDRYRITSPHPHTSNPSFTLHFFFFIHHLSATWFLYFIIHYSRGWKIIFKLVTRESLQPVQTTWLKFLYFLLPSLLHTLPPVQTSSLNQQQLTAQLALPWVMSLKYLHNIIQRQSGLCPQPI